MEVATILVVAAEIFPSEAGGRNAVCMSIGGRRAPIRTRHGVTSLLPAWDRRWKDEGSTTWDML